MPPFPPRPRPLTSAACPQVVVLATQADASRQLGSLGAQLDVDFSRHASHLDGLDERWAQVWRVHEKVVRAEAKGWS